MNYLKKTIRNCKQATLLIEKKSFGRLTFKEGIEMRIHLLGCSMCTLYSKQSRIINDMVFQLYHAAPASPITPDDSFKKYLQNRPDERLNKE